MAVNHDLNIIPNNMRASNDRQKKQPSIATMRRWMNDGVAKATDGCRVEPDGICPHGCKSWILKLGLI